jgi:hypothetical protein
LYLLVVLSLSLKMDGWPETKKYVAGIVVLALITNVAYLATPNTTNREQLELIGELKARNITYGYAWFQVCEPLTYLSKGDVKIMSAYPWGEQVKVNHWLNEENYIRDGGRACIIMHDEPAWPYVLNNKDEYNFTYKGYAVYVYGDLKIS